MYNYFTKGKSYEQIPDSHKTTMTTNVRESKLSQRITKSMIETEKKFLNNHKDYDLIIEVNSK